MYWGRLQTNRAPRRVELEGLQTAAADPLAGRAVPSRRGVRGSAWVWPPGAALPMASVNFTGNVPLARIQSKYPGSSSTACWSGCGSTTTSSVVRSRRG